MTGVAPPGRNAEEGPFVASGTTTIKSTSAIAPAKTGAYRTAATVIRDGGLPGAGGFDSGSGTVTNLSETGLIRPYVCCILAFSEISQMFLVGP